MFVEKAYANLHKHGEELCGDSAMLKESTTSVMAVLSDGLGSGVKANILATITSKVAITMLHGGASIDEVVETLGRTLPVCRVRNVAYSTFTILQVSSSGLVYLAEFDNPSVVAFRKGIPLEIQRRSRTIGSLTVKEAKWQGREGDLVVAVSDGVMHSGIGRTLDFGWLPHKYTSFVQALSKRNLGAKEVCSKVLKIAESFYGGMPRDDTTVMALKLRRRRTVTVAVGPPKDPSFDREFAHKLAGEPQYRVICGGTTAILVARELRKSLEVKLPDNLHDTVPPMGEIAGISLVTEGIITLSRALDYLKVDQIPEDDNGATQLSALLEHGDEIRFLVGRAVNPAHQNPNLPVSFSLKQQVIMEISQLLESKGKRVAVEFY